MKDPAIAKQLILAKLRESPLKTGEDKTYIFNAECHCG